MRPWLRRGFQLMNTGLWGDIRLRRNTRPQQPEQYTRSFDRCCIRLQLWRRARRQLPRPRAGDVPMVCFHPVTDPFAPYGDGTVIVPTTGDRLST